MGEILLIALAVVVGLFGFVLLFGAPYLPTLRPQIETALDMLELEEGQTMLELGCGDGRVLLAAAKRGWHGVGYELNPLLAGIAWLRTRRYGTAVQIHCADFWRATWPPSDGIFAFNLQKYMVKLDKKIIQQADSPQKLVSFAFHIPGREPTASRDGLFRYDYK